MGGGGDANAGNQRVSQDAPVISSLRIQTSAYGRPIPFGFGKNRVAGNLLWYGDFKAIAHVTSTSTGGGSGGKGGGGGSVPTQQTITYTYTAAVLILLGRGPIQTVHAVWRDKERTSLGALGFSLFLGTNTQVPFSHLSTFFPSYALAYRHRAYVAAAALDLGDAAQLQNHSFEVQWKTARGSTGHTPKSFTVNMQTDQVTCAAHGYTAHLLVRVSSTGQLPAPLQAGADYYVENPTADTFQLSSQAGGTIIDLQPTATVAFTGNASGQLIVTSLSSSVKPGDYVATCTAIEPEMYFDPEINVPDGNPGAYVPTGNKWYYFDVVDPDGVNVGQVWGFDAMIYGPPGIPGRNGSSVEVMGLRLDMFHGFFHLGEYWTISVTTSGSGTHSVVPYVYDADPKDVVTEILLMAGIAPSRIGDLTAFSNYCIANGILVAPVYIEQRPAAELLENLAMIGNSDIIYSEDQIKLVPYSDEAVTANGVTFMPNASPVFALTEDDFLAEDGEEPVELVDEDMADAYNVIKLKFSNRDKDYAEDVVEAQDDDDIWVHGRRELDEPISALEIVDPRVAQMVVRLILQHKLYFRMGYRFSLGPGKADLLEPMDVVSLTYAPLGLSAVPVRIREIEEIDDERRDGFSFLVREFPAGAASAVLYPDEKGSGYNVNFNVLPGDVNTPVIFDAPAVATDSGFELWMAVSGASSNWGGCQVWSATDPGGPYKQVGNIHGAGRHGFLSAVFAAAPDPDETNVLSVDLTISRGSLSGGTQADADNFSTLSWVEGELVSFETAALTATHKYNLEDYVRRGVFNTPILPHVKAERFVRADQALFRYPYDPDLVGKTLYVKLPSFNVFGFATQGLDEVSAHAYLIQGPIGAPDAPTGFTVQQTGGILNFHVDAVEYLKLDRVEVRYADPGETDWNNGLPVTNILRGNTDSNGSVPPGEWRFFARTFDRANTPSKTWAVFDFFVDAEGFETIESRSSGPTWANLQFQNLISRSEELDDAAYSRAGIKAFGSGSVADSTAKLTSEGFNTAEYLQADTSTGQHRLDRAAALTVGASQTISAFAAPGEYTKVWLGSGSTNATDRVLFDLVAGTVSNQGANVTAANVGLPNGDGFRRIWAHFAAAPSATFCVGAVDVAGDVSFTGSGNDGFYATGLQVNDGAVPLPYAKTSAAANATADYFVKSVTAALVPESLQLAASLADADLWDKYVSHPQPFSTYTQLEIDKGIDGTVRVWTDIVSTLGPGVAEGTSSPKGQIDYRLAAGAYDGFEDWAVGTANFRYLKGGLRLDSSIGVAKITQFKTVIDAEPRTVTGTFTTDGTGSVPVTFAQPFHIAPPGVIVTPEGSGNVSASYTSLSATGFTGHFKSGGVAAAGTATYSTVGV